MTESSVRDGYVKGSLGQVPFPKALNFINQAGKSGIMALSQGKRKVHIHFDRGEIVYVTSSYFPEMSLGDYLVKEGMITPEVNQESIEFTRNDKIKQGAYLVEKGHLSPHDLYAALNTQVSKKLFKLFAWGEGEFYFREGEIIGEEHRILNISFPNLLYRGIRFYLPMEKPPMEFRGRKEDILVKRLAGRYRIEDLQLGPADIRIYNLINGERTLRQIVTASNMNKRAAYKVLYALYLLELVGFPEAFRSDRIVKQKELKKKEAKRDERGYSISVSNDLIAEAMASVDRIKEEVKREDDGTPFTSGPTREPAAMSFGIPTPKPTPVVPPKQEVEVDDDFISQVNKSLKDSSYGVGRDKGAGRAPAVEPISFAPPKLEEPPAFESFAAGVEETLPPSKTPPSDPFGMPKDSTGDELDSFGDISLEVPNSLPTEEELLSDKSVNGLEQQEGMDELDKAEGGLLMDVDDYSNPEDLLKQASFLLDDGKWSEARRFLERAVSLDDQNADAYALLGWAIFNQEGGSGGGREAEKTIKKGMRINPNRYLHFLYLGKIYAAIEQFEFAELHFVKALELNVECSEAKEEIKRIHNR